MRLPLRPTLPAAVAAAAVLVLSLPVSSRAADGVLEISQTCATQTGCFTGDAAGFPVTITAAAPARSFRLTSDLQVATADTTAVLIQTPQVQIDLGGFAITGVTTCAGIPTTSCTPTGAGVGISGNDAVSVHNGSIRGMGSDGIRLSWSARIDDVHVWNNGGSGITVGDAAIIRGCHVYSNQGFGIFAGRESEIMGNHVSGNGSAGIRSFGGVVAGNGVGRNGGYGGLFFDGVAFFANSFTGNGDGSVAGGSATGGNVCDDGRCSRDGGRRRYFLSTTPAPGNEALSACGAGFHMASLPELHAATTLAYDDALAPRPGLDGRGPPTQLYGWVRTGAPSDVGTVDGNCALWSSAASNDNGRMVRFGSAVTSGPLAPWIAQASSCNTPHFVWCAED